MVHAINFGIKKLLLGWCNGPAVKGDCHQSDNLSFISETHVVEGKNQPTQVVLDNHPHKHTHTHIHREAHVK